MVRHGSLNKDPRATLTLSGAARVGHRNKHATKQNVMTSLKCVVVIETLDVLLKICSYE